MEPRIEHFHLPPRQSPKPKYSACLVLYAERAKFYRLAARAAGSVDL
nr:MAG TPA: hypothetical protein [Caudoviricetes sp.]